MLSVFIFQYKGRFIMQKIKRGDIYFADFSPAIGSEQNGERPCVVIQNDVGNHHSPTIVVAVITSKNKNNNLPTHIELPADNGLTTISLVLLEHLRTIDKRRLIRYLGALDERRMGKIDRALAVSIGLKHTNTGGCYN